MWSPRLRQLGLGGARTSSCAIKRGHSHCILPGLRNNVVDSVLKKIMHRRIEVWQIHDYWIYELWIAGRCVVIGRASTYERAMKCAQLA